MPSTTPIDVAKSQFLDAVNSAPDVLIITPGAGALATPCRGLRANTAGTITVTTFAGQSRVLNFAAGETRYVGVTHVTAATATGIEGLI